MMSHQYADNVSGSAGRAIGAVLKLGKKATTLTIAYSQAGDLVAGIELANGKAVELPALNELSQDVGPYEAAKVIYTYCRWRNANGEHSLGWPMSLEEHTTQITHFSNLF